MGVQKLTLKFMYSVFLINRWLNPSDPCIDSTEITFDKSRKIIDSEFEFLILEFRDSFGTVVKFVEPESETKRVDLNLVFRQQQIPNSCEIVAVNSNGTVFKTHFN